jgi:hypothetical protein
MNNTKLFNEFITSEDLEKYKNNNLENYTNYVTHRDLELIFDGIDKTDYTTMGCLRWKDLSHLLDKLINRKIENPLLKLEKVKIIRILETFPPQNQYYLSFN